MISRNARAGFIVNRLNPGLPHLMRLSTARRLAAAAVLTGLLALGSAGGQTVRRPKIARLSYGDYLVRGPELSSKAGIEASFRKMREAGFTDIYWRMLTEGHPLDGVEVYPHPMLEEAFRARKELEGTPWAWDPHEIRWPIEVAHKLGMKFYASIVIYNERAPMEAWLASGEPAEDLKFRAGTFKSVGDAYRSKFLLAHPEYQLVDRTGKRYHWGVLEWAYPEARQYWLRDLQLILDRYDVDGIYLDTRTECMSPDFADQFGFNEPVIREFQKRYGVNILEEDFDLEAWRGLRGEYFTQLLREMSLAIHAKGKRFSLGTARGDYIGFPLGNMKLEWRKWIAEKLIDELHLDEHGWGWGRQGYGYVTDFATGRGLRPLDVMIREDYSPLCRKHGVKLYFRCNPYKVRPPSEACCNGRASLQGIKTPADYCERMSALPEVDGTIEKPAVQPW